MATLEFDGSSIPDLEGKVAVITGGASGIGLAAVKIMLEKKATVHIIDRNQPIAEEGWHEWPSVHFHRCDVADWTELRDTINTIGPFDLAFANAAVAETFDYFADEYDDEHKLQLPDPTLLNVNIFGVLHMVKLAWSSMRRHKIRGSIVITASTTSYAPEATLPLYSTGKVALLGLVRSLRHNIVLDNITINAVAPAGTLTPLLGTQVDPLVKMGLPFNSSQSVGLALVYSATAMQHRRVEAYGREQEADIWKTERWNGRIIYVIGGTYTELEEPIADLRNFWFGRENLRLTRWQQAVLDNRKGIEAKR